MEALQKNGISDCVVRQIAIPDAFIEHGKPQHQREICGLEAPQIVIAVKKLLQNREPALGIVS
jgi:deoxyxylulose-5-phosphate synthase